MWTRMWMLMLIWMGLGLGTEIRTWDGGMEMRWASRSPALILAQQLSLV